MSLEDEIVKSRKKQTMMQMVAADKLAAKKKIEARRAKAKLLKSKKTNTSTKYNALEKAYIKKYGQSAFKGSVPTSDSKSNVTVVKSNPKNKRLETSKNKKISENFMQQIALKVENEKKNNNIKTKAGDKEKDKSSKSSKDGYKKYSSISAAKAAGSLYYSKNGKKMAAVFAEDLKGLTGSPQEKLRKYLNARTKKMSMGGSLKAVPSANTGLKKLPTPVRNKMGYMNKGGTPKKANKGMLIITIGSAKKMKKKKGKS